MSSKQEICSWRNISWRSYNIFAWTMDKSSLVGEVIWDLSLDPSWSQCFTLSCWPTSDKEKRLPLIAVWSGQSMVFSSPTAVSICWAAIRKFSSSVIWYSWGTLLSNYTIFWVDFRLFQQFDVDIRESIFDIFSPTCDCFAVCVSS